MIEHTYMVQPTPQREWVEKRGWWLVLAFFLGGLGGGAYLVSLYLGSLTGQVVGWLIVVVGKGSAHLIYLGRPLRFWRGFLKPQTSWISRGLVAIAIFAVFGLMHMAPALPQLSWLPWRVDNPVIIGLSVLGAFSLIIYTGFAMGVVKAIPFWNSALLPVLFVVCALLGGTGLTLGLSLASPEGVSNIHYLETLARVLLISGAVIIGVYLWVMYDSAPAARRSVLDLVKGRAALPFLLGVVVLGILVPLSVSIYGFYLELPYSVLAVAIICELVGGFFLRYSLLKAGTYTPVI